MKNSTEKREYTELEELCESVRASVLNEEYDSPFELVRQAMQKYPHSPEPHNLMGIILEKTGDHLRAMKHFRAAWALDPTYLPASHNLHTYGTFFSGGACAFDESDLPSVGRSTIEIVYDDRGVGHAIKKNKIKYDDHGIGHVARG